ncbi:MAG: hypothetical protein ACO1NW_07310 [Chitinophagaceae bacterium]
MKKLIIAAFSAAVFLVTACGNARDNADATSDSITPTPGMNDPANSTYDPNTMDSANQMRTDSLRTDTTNR